MNADDPKFTAHVLGEFEDLTPDERAEIDALLVHDPAAAAEAAQTRALAARLRAELQDEAAPALDEKQRAAVFDAAEEIGVKKKIASFPARVKLRLAIAAGLAVAVSAALLLPGISRRQKAREVHEPIRELALEAPGTATPGAGNAPGEIATVASPQSTPASEVPGAHRLAPEDSTTGAVAAAPTLPNALAKTDKDMAGENGLTPKKNSEARETLDRLDTFAKAEEKAPSTARRPESPALLAAQSAAPAPQQSEKALTEGEVRQEIEVQKAMKKEVAAAPMALPSEAATDRALDESKVAVRKTAVVAAAKAAPLAPAGAAAAAPGGATTGTRVVLDSGDERGKEPTVIESLEATFDQRAHEAVFVGQVVMKDPGFNIWCDKLTAYLKDEVKNANGGRTATRSAASKDVALRPDQSTPAVQGDGRLDHVVAAGAAGHRVKITQDKVDPETGKMKHTVGYADRAEYDTKTGDVILYGNPEVTQGQDRCVATAPSTVFTLTRDGHITAVGPHRTSVVD